MYSTAITSRNVFPTIIISGNVFPAVITNGNVFPTVITSGNLFPTVISGGNAFAHALEQIARAPVARTPNKEARCFLGRSKAKWLYLKTTII